MITATEPPQGARGPRAGHPREVLAFRIGAEDYGVDILRVQEIRSYEEPTHLAGAPPSIRGVLDLRGAVVPIVDLRRVFGLDRADVDGATVVIVLSLASRVVGIVVDAVSDVVTLRPAQLRPVPSFNGRIRAEHLDAIATLDDRMLIVVDIERLMASPEVGLTAAMAD